MSGSAHSSYSGRGILRNGPFASTLDRVFQEALACEVTCGPEAGSTSLDDPPRSNSFRLERCEGRLHELLVNASPGQIVLNQSVAGTALGEELGARFRETPIVDGAGFNQ